jgi:hypothetical protein
MRHVQRYQRIAPLYDLLDLPFERWRYRALRPLLFRGLKGHLLDAGIATGRNCEFLSSRGNRIRHRHQPSDALPVWQRAAGSTKWM